jgi:hypothetical protein
MTVIAQVPVPLPDDAGEVTEALDVASSLWKAGNRQDAIRWVRRAAQAADDAGDSQRMSALARVSADLEESLTAALPVASSAPPPLPARAAGSSVPAPPASAGRMRSKTTPPPLKTTPPPLPRASTAPAATAPAENGLRLRVSIKTSTLDPTLLVVRCLEKGKGLPAGVTEGWVVLRESTTGEGGHTNGKSVR